MFDALIQKVLDNPVMVVGVVTYVLAMFGVPEVVQGEVGEVVQALVVLAGLWYARSKVSPVSQVGWTPVHPG